MRTILPLLAVFALCATALGAPPPVESTPLRIGSEVPTFHVTDLSGQPFDLAKAREITDEQAVAKAKAAAAPRAGGAPVDVDTSLASLPGLQTADGSLDPAKRQEMLQEVGREYGLVVGPDTGTDLTTVGDVAAWLVERAAAPMVFMCWSPKCQTSKGYETRLMALLADAGARFYPLASNSKNETDQDARDFLATENLPYRVLLDRDHKVCDLLGGKVTPHVFLLDGENRLVYEGAIDSDPHQTTRHPGERQNWLADAIDAAEMGQPADVLVTTPKG